ncbi:hypothetical protein B0H14DRAFT_2973499 [Mycena olivaceomarginata]|nr:hypothetical protein B0H14DRAFT_2973499 [Mycena olivaceomarginata]
MASTSSAPPGGKPTNRSGAIYNSADLLYSLLESEVENAVKPYQAALDSAHRQLHALGALNNGNHNNASINPGAEMELRALKAALETSGLGLVISDNHPTLRFIGENGKILSVLDSAIKSFSAKPETVPPISPATIVSVLVEGFAECNRRLDVSSQQYATLRAEKDALSTELAQHEASRTQLAEERKKVAALTEALGVLRAEAVKLAAWTTSKHKAAEDEWKKKHHAVEAERDSLKRVLDTTEAQRGSSQTDLDAWRAKCLAAQADLKSCRDEADEWKAKYLALEVESKAAKLESDAKLAAKPQHPRRMEDQVFRTRGGSASIECGEVGRTGRSQCGSGHGQSGRRVGAVGPGHGEGGVCYPPNRQGRGRRRSTHVAGRGGGVEGTRGRVEGARKDHTSSLQSSVSAKEKLEADLEAAQTALTDWAAKAAAWDAERNRHKTQTARNSALIGQFQTELTSLKIKLREVEGERDAFKGERDAFKSERDTFKGERDSFKEAEVRRKGRRDALQIKAKEAQQQLDGAKKAEAELDSALEMEAEIELELGGVKAAASSAAPTAASASPVSPALPKAMFIRPRPTPSRTLSSLPAKPPPPISWKAQAQSPLMPNANSGSGSGSAGPDILGAAPSPALSRAGAKGKGVWNRSDSVASPASSAVSTPTPAHAQSKSKSNAAAGATARPSASAAARPTPKPSSSSAKRSAEDPSSRPTTGKRLGSHSNGTSSSAASTSKPDSPTSLKRSAPSALVSEKIKVPRKTATPANTNTTTDPRKPPALDGKPASERAPRKPAPVLDTTSSSSSSAGFTRPPTPIRTPRRAAVGAFSSC